MMAGGIVGHIAGWLASMSSGQLASLLAGWLTLIFAENLPLPQQRGGVCKHILAFSPYRFIFAHHIANLASCIEFH
jgi:hypothetical protein